jgi:glycosyltransferase involved in cell wall biosynthesis
MKLTALIPAYNDAYTLRFCLASIVAHFDEIIVMDDASTDETPDVCLDFVHRVHHVRYVRHEGRQLGWIGARNVLAGLTDSEHLFWLDADDVLCEYNAHLLREIAAGPRPAVRLQLCEMWGDFYHTTQRLRHYDRCHVYTNRRVLGDVTWSGGTCAWPGWSAPIGGVNGPGPLFFHIKGVKPDRRLVSRSRIRHYLRDENRENNLESCLAGLDDVAIHELALRFLFTSRQDRLTPTYQAQLGISHPSAPRRPEVIEDALPGRFEITHDPAGQPLDRVDHSDASSVPQAP